MKSSNYFSLVFLGILRLARPAVAANGTCISSPESSCTTLVALCVNKVASGQVLSLSLLSTDLDLWQVASNNFWSVPECFTGATCAGVCHFSNPSRVSMSDECGCGLTVCGCIRCCMLCGYLHDPPPAEQSQLQQGLFFVDFIS